MRTIDACERGAKDPRAELRIELLADRGWVWCTVVDDGRGVDRGRLVQLAVKNGLLTPAQASVITPADALMLVFADGLSSASAVSDTSGRGIGMAAVRGIVERLGGAVTLRSTPGEGTRVELRWPAC